MLPKLTAIQQGLLFASRAPSQLVPLILSPQTPSLFTLKPHPAFTCSFRRLSSAKASATVVSRSSHPQQPSKVSPQTSSTLSDSLYFQNLVADVDVESKPLSKAVVSNKDPIPIAPASRRTLVYEGQLSRTLTLARTVARVFALGQAIALPYFCSILIDLVVVTMSLPLLATWSVSRMYATRIWTQEDISYLGTQVSSPKPKLNPTLVFETRTNLTGTAKLRAIRVSDLRLSSGLFSTWEVAVDASGRWGWAKKIWNTVAEPGFLVDTAAVRTDPVIGRVAKIVEGYSESEDKTL
ncbi:hypothetical protein BC829DRAFT_401697 [Chytridium lagenaria]|nr:hypothetical protein BC829DRAFT_401697 [Chytridium lagenaria]